MKITINFFILALFAFALNIPLMARAVSYPISEEHRLLSAKGAVKVGATFTCFTAEHLM